MLKRNVIRAIAPVVAVAAGLTLATGGGEIAGATKPHAVHAQHGPTAQQKRAAAVWCQDVHTTVFPNTTDPAADLRSVAVILTRQAAEVPDKKVKADMMFAADSENKLGSGQAGLVDQRALKAAAARVAKYGKSVCPNKKDFA